MFLRQTAFAVTCSLGHSSVARSRLGQRAFWLSVQLLTSLLRNTWVLCRQYDAWFEEWFPYLEVCSLIILDLDGTRVYAVVTRSFAASPLISSWCHRSYFPADKLVLLSSLSHLLMAVSILAFHLWSSLSHLPKSTLFKPVNSLLNHSCCTNKKQKFLLKGLENCTTKNFSLSSVWKFHIKVYNKTSGLQMVECPIITRTVGGLCYGWLAVSLSTQIMNIFYQKISACT